MIKLFVSVSLYVLLLGLTALGSRCPFASVDNHFDNPHPAIPVTHQPSSHSFHRPQHRAQVVDYDAVKQDILQLLTNSQPFWPADVGPDGPNYGPFFIRLAWHCTGSYRNSDGRGGCDGGNIRFEPVRSWPDNTNLDKALLLLEPIKIKYGAALSWGDLIVLTGNTAIESMGGPILGFCGGRIDDPDGSNSWELGPTDHQQQIAPCPINGRCEPPLGTDTVGLIYVNPEGVMANHNPTESAPEIRRVFARMDMNDSETVALIGGGHSFGRTHGACPAGAGPSPKEDPYNPWPGLCSNGTFTSGLNGPWTATPTTWGNDYFRNLLTYNYELVPSPGGAKQFEPTPGQGAPDDIMMLTTDIALLQDVKYKALVQEFAETQAQLNNAFSHAWYKLTTRDMGPVTRCVGNNVPPAQPFQNPLPSTDPSPADIDFAYILIEKSLYNGGSFSDQVNGYRYQGALYVQLAWQSANTFRHTDYRGGADGATIRFPPQSGWEVNKGMDLVLQQLSSIKNQVGDNVSWADLIVLAGQVALENADPDFSLSFCSGRGDARNGDKAVGLQPRSYITDPILSSVDTMRVMGLTPEEYVALEGRPRSPAYMKKLGYSGSWTTDPSQLNNEYFITLLNNTWKLVGSQTDKVGEKPTTTQEYKAVNDDLYITGLDLAILHNPMFKRIAENFAHSNELFLHSFAHAWTKVMNADRFDGPWGNLCYP